MITKRDTKALASGRKTGAVAALTPRERNSISKRMLEHMLDRVRAQRGSHGRIVKTGLAM